MLLRKVKASLHTDLKKLVDYLCRYRHFRESRTFVYYDRAATQAEEKNQSAHAIVTQMAAKTRTHALDHPGAP